MAPNSNAIMSKSPQRLSLRGFTLVELMITVGMMSAVLLGLTQSYIFIMKSSVSLGNFSDINFQSRRGLEQFSRDMRMASDVLEANLTFLVVEVPNSAGTAFNRIEYDYDGTDGELIRRENGIDRVLYDDVASCSFLYFEYRGNSTAVLAKVKQVQMDMEIVRGNPFLQTTRQVTSARIMMRSREVTN